VQLTLVMKLLIYVPAIPLQVLPVLPWNQSSAMDAITKISAMIQTQTLPLPLKHVFQPLNALVALDSMKLFQVEVLIAMVVCTIAKQYRATGSRPFVHLRFLYATQLWWWCYHCSTKHR
jgi:hypothetical protein